MTYTLSDHFPNTKMFVLKYISDEGLRFFISHILGEPQRIAYDELRKVDIDEVAKTLAWILHFKDSGEELADAEHQLANSLGEIIMERLETIGLTTHDLWEYYKETSAGLGVDQVKLIFFGKHRERLRIAEESHSAIMSGAL